MNMYTIKYINISMIFTFFSDESPMFSKKLNIYWDVMVHKKCNFRKRTSYVIWNNRSGAQMYFSHYAYLHNTSQSDLRLQSAEVIRWYISKQKKIVLALHFQLQKLWYIFSTGNQLYFLLYFHHQEWYSFFSVGFGTCINSVPIF